MKKCLKCGKPATRGPRGGMSHCDECRAYFREYTLKRYHARKKEGLCRSCDQPIDYEHSVQYCAKHYEEWRESTREYRSEYSKGWWRKQRKKALERYGNACNHCGKSGGRLEFHHINGDGHIDRASRTGKNRGPHGINRRIALNGREPGIVLLCMTCHTAQHR